MTERAVVEAAAALAASGEPFLIATVVAVRGSAYRQPGARMLLTRDRWIAGSVSGGCLEHDLVHQGWWRTDHGAPAIVTYDSRIDEDDPTDDELRQALGLGCNGIVEILLERSDRCGVDPLAFIACCHRAQERGALATVFASDLPDVPIGARLAVSAHDRVGELASTELEDAVLSDARRVLASGDTVVETYPLAAGAARVLIEAVTPPPRLFVLGAGHDALPVIELARAIGWDVVVCAPHARPSIRARFHPLEVVFATAAEIGRRIDTSDRAAVIVMNHHYEHDRACLAAALTSRARYIGVLGPRHRTARMLAELAPTIPRDDRLHAPVGLDLGAETPQEIALAIIAETQAVLTRATGSSLRDRPGAIHVAPVTDAGASRPRPAGDPAAIAWDMP